MADINQVIPKYYQIATGIIREIQQGKLALGGRILSENEIIHQYGVSNTTARKALQEIERTGWATKIKGKGTFVRDNKVDRPANKILSFTRNMLHAGRRPSTKVLDSRILQMDQSCDILGRRYTLKGPLLKIHRLRFADDLPMMLEVRYISMTFCPEIDRKNLEGSLYGLYANDYGLQLTEIEQKLSVVKLGPGLPEFFDLKETIPAFRVEGITLCGKELILDMEDSLYRGDQYQFVIRAT
ncbi:MAG: GntR family transcriptional regulator [Planctomycetes bacterium]|nr:GntR family transcriptional regulator [Planctomycetota bacterium]